jgi:hypothetical protein
MMESLIMHAAIESKNSPTPHIIDFIKDIIAHLARSHLKIHPFNAG